MPRRDVIPWLVTLAISAAITLPLVLKHPRHHYTIGARVVGGLIIWVGLAAVVRFVIFVVDWLRSRYAT